VDCDCAGCGAEKVVTPNIGIIASTDILAVDQAGIDLLYALSPEDGAAIRERIETRHGHRQLSYMKELGMGNDRYLLLDIDHEDTRICPAEAVKGVVPFVEEPETERRRIEYLKMMEQAEERNRINLDNQDEDDVETDTFTYTGTEKPPKNVKTLIVSPEVQEIPDGEFKDLTELKDVVFSDETTDMKIGKNAFENCPMLTTIRLNGVTFIGDEAFLNCTGLVAVELGSDIQHIGMGAFKNCTSLTTVTIPPNVTFVGDYAFANCAGLKTATVMDGVVEIPAYCFQNDNALEQVELPMSIEKVGDNAFENCVSAMVLVPTTDMKEAEELLGVKMVAKAEEDESLFKCDQGYVVKLYKDLY
jgi:hypothetical protein